MRYVVYAFCAKENTYRGNNNSQNCTVNSAKKGTLTLQEIGEIYQITRMRVCQIEKLIIDKIKKSNLIPNLGYLCTIFFITEDLKFLHKHILIRY